MLRSRDFAFNLLFCCFSFCGALCVLAVIRGLSGCVGGKEYEWFEEAKSKVPPIRASIEAAAV